MSLPRIVLFGATGYTGRLTAEALVRRGRHPVLAGRRRADLDELAERLGCGLETVVADASSPGSVRDLVGKGDVLVTTAGPFVRLGDAAAEAAVAQCAHYVDSSGEPTFTRRVFERYGPAAARSGTGMLPAFGWESVLGNLAGALALEQAGETAVRVDTGYFGLGAVGFSGGTRASFADAMLLPSFAYRDARIRTVRGAERYRTLRAGGRERPCVSLGASEHFALPRSFPELREVNAYLGWFGRLSPRVARPLHALSRMGFWALGLPGMRRVLLAARGRFAGGSKDGPAAGERARGGVHVVGLAYDARGALLGEAHLSGVDGYSFTAAILAWAAERIAASGLAGVGALGPVEAFGIEALQAGCREAGVVRV